LGKKKRISISKQKTHEYASIEHTSLISRGPSSFARTHCARYAVKIIQPVHRTNMNTIIGEVKDPT
jgi:hypothetical protein